MTSSSPISSLASNTATAISSITSSTAASSARNVLQRLYERTIRRQLPRTLGVYNGVVTRRYYLLDLQGRTHEPDYKQELVESLRGAVEPGDTVLEIGAGFGVCTARAAQAVGNAGRVISYEANAEQVTVAREALELTGDVREESLSDRVEIRHAIVGADVEIYGTMAGATRVPKSKLPACDVLVMDCEGAERDILREMDVEPRNVVVESHPEARSPAARLEELLSARGYAIDSTPVTTTETGSKDILTGTLEEA